jgi:molybdate transport system substrate-binding protein
VPASTAAQGAPSGENLTVYAAASLTDAFREMATLFQTRTGARVDFNFGASNTLRTQLEQGAVADIFASANTMEMQNLAKAGLLVGDPSVFASNRLVVVVPRENTGKVSRLQDLSRSGLKFVTALPHVPVGQYTVAALEKMSADPAFGSDFKQKVDANTVSKEDSVRSVLSKVALGEADAGVVYVSDIVSAQRERVTTLAIPDQFNTVATYPIAVVKGGKRADQARKFIDFVLSPEGQAVLANYSFIPARP